MANAVANIKAVVTADTRRASAELSRFGNTATTTGKGINKAWLVAAAATTAAAAAAVKFGKDSIKSYMESENALAQLNATLKSTKGVAGVTATQATELAESLQKVTRFSDEEVLAAENLLLTFTKINKDIFPETTQLVLDMSQALGQDLKSSSIQLGKALQDPIKGVTALRRVGVNFNQAQTEVIKKLVETGQSAKAQRLILKELRTEFGGSAEAAGKTFAGKLAILKNNFDELKESVGGFLVNALIPITGGLNEFVSTMRGSAETFEGVGGTVVMTMDQVKVATNNQKIATQNLSAAQKEHQATMAAYKVSQNQVKAAQDQLNAATARYGPDSTQAKNAAESLRKKQNELGIQLGRTNTSTTKLKDAKLRLRDANRQVKSSAEDAEKAEREFGKTSKNAVTLVDAFGKKVTFVAGEIEAYLGLMQEAVNTGALKIDYSNGALTAPPKKASGTDFFRPRRHAAGISNTSGMALVGERGPEMVTLPRGSKVSRADETARMMGGNTTINLTIQAGAYMGSQQDARKYAQLVVNAIKDIAVMKGTTPDKVFA